MRDFYSSPYRPLTHINDASHFRWRQSLLQSPTPRIARPIETGMVCSIEARTRPSTARRGCVRPRGDHRGACPRPLGDVAVIRIGPEIEAEGDAGLSEVLGVAGAAIRVFPQVGQNSPHVWHVVNCGQQDLSHS